MVLYNGVAGVPTSNVPGHNGGFRSPWIFNPTTGQWRFEDNSQSYASQRVREELEGIGNGQNAQE